MKPVVVGLMLAWSAVGACDARPERPSMTRPSDEEFAAAVGQPGGKIKKLRGGPYFYQFEVNHVAREVLVLDGKIAPKGLDSLGRYLRAIQMLDKKSMQLEELLNLLGTYGELPEAFDFWSARSIRGPQEGPVLRYGEREAQLIIYAHEPASKPGATPPGAPSPPQPVGERPPRYRRATLVIPSDYRLKWKVERYDALHPGWTPL
jgi:hypothetical protein